MTGTLVKEEQHLEEHSKNSLTAKSGYRAEDIFRTDKKIKCNLEKYFGKNIRSIAKIHGKKYDSKIYFEDGSIVNIQNKKIENLGGRGDSFDRRHIKNTFTSPEIKKYLPDKSRQIVMCDLSSAARKEYNHAVLRIALPARGPFGRLSRICRPCGHGGWDRKSSFRRFPRAVRGFTAARQAGVDAR